MLINIPDSAFSNGGIQASKIDDSETVKIAKAIIKADKIRRKEKENEVKAKAEKSKPKTFTLLETTGLIAITSISLPYLQKLVNIWISTNLNVPTP